ncbi:MAG: diphosphate--fructose-6-phosphate 1-phosphotransferase [Opitutales bacterium]|nr:diphosphate--fructose-6-phosphate 1-phosphotransferase [Opitutales bacterium]
MAEELQGNFLVVQSGPAAAVSNAVLAGVISQALNHGCIEEIYGVLGGVEGLLREEFTDLAEESQQTIRALRHTPGAALGTSLYQLHLSHEFERVIEVCKAHEIRFFVMIGGSDEMATAASICEQAKTSGWDMNVIGMPVCAGNTIAMTDHAPGYGSAVKFIASMVREVALDAEGEGEHNLVTVIEVMGRQSGWLAAGSTLAKRKDHPEDAPHLIYLPEVPFDPNRYLDDVSHVLKHHRNCVVVVSQGLFDENGNYISFGSDAEIVAGSPRGGSGDYLRDLASQHLQGVRSNSCRLNMAQRCASHFASATDVKEAFRAGQDAVEAIAENGANGKMLMLVRGENDSYSCETSLCDLSEAIAHPKTLPAAWINEDKTSISYQFNKYALPLIMGEAEVPTENGVPLAAHLEFHLVEKVLE